MSTLGFLVKQWRKPTGWLGSSIAWVMNVNHSKQTDWGLRQVSIERHWTILDVGCGGGRTVHRLAEIAAAGRVYGVDFSEASIAVSRRTNQRLIELGRVEIQYGSVSRLPFPPYMFDLVTATNTHYYWPDLRANLQEVLRVLKPGGKLLLLGAGYKGGKYDGRDQKRAGLLQVTFYSLDEFSELLTRAGYTDVQVLEEYDQGWICGIGEKPA